MRILLVEDEAPLRAMEVRILRDFTSKIVEVETLREAMEACRREEFDLILLDLVLKDAERERTLSAIEDIKKLARAPVIVVSGTPEPSIRETVMAYGADNFLSKDAAFSNNNRAFLLALHAAVLKKPKSNEGDSFFRHVELLEKLVAAA